jgi:hypothetical protein
MPFENPETGQEFEDFDACVDTVSAWDGIDTSQAEAMCGSWQAETKGNIRYNASDPTESSRIRKSWQDELRRRVENVSKQIPNWFERNSGKLQNIRLRFTQWFRTQLFEQVLEQTDEGRISGGRHWTGSYIRRAYQRGLQLARRDLESMSGFTSFRIKQQTRFRSSFHQEHAAREYNQAYAGLRDQMFRAVDRVGSIIREGIDAEEDRAWFIEEIQGHIDSDMQNAARSHANTIVVDAVNEALLTTFEQIGIQNVGVAPESQEASLNQVNAIRLNDGMFDFRADDPDTPDDVQFVTAGDASVCPECRGLEGTTVDISEGLSSEGSLSGGLRSVIPVHVNCRCRWVPIDPS